jgi:hypothetical protein
MIAALFGVGVLANRGKDTGDAKPDAAAKVEQVAQRLERIRRLEFERIPPVRTISASQAREEGLAALDDDYPPRRRAADQDVLTLLGLLPTGSDLRELAGTIFGEEVAGFYDDRSKEMTVIGESAEGVDGEITLAHELTHALEDQHFDLHHDEGLDDARTARTALVEGTATVAMVDYSVRYLTKGRARRGDLLDQLALVDLIESSSGLPPYLQRSLTFPYASGARFVDAIGTWTPADHALAGAGPVSTEQILHPGKYLSHEPPLRVRLGPPGHGWSRAAAGSVGEFDTGELIRSSDSPVRAELAAAGWGGGRYELWRRGGRRALTLGWRWDTPLDAAQFVAALPRYVERTLRGRAAGPGLWRAKRRGWVALAPGEVTRLAIAPSRALARKLAG